jgi:hypothetical protein
MLRTLPALADGTAALVPCILRGSVLVAAIVHEIA